MNFPSQGVRKAIRTRPLPLSRDKRGERPLLKICPEGDLAEAIWVDLIDPSAEEVAKVEQALGIDVPSRASLAEIEASSRLRTHENILYMSAPLIAGTEGHRWSLAPTGFVLSRERLVTVRFAELGAFDEIHKE
ncbi:MAG: hypothetical protein JOY99_06120, partial [Sphingomonadaceae bacterium]|nr:hypothetical protein [Sphingomonadaceae bacterium]